MHDLLYFKWNFQVSNNLVPSGILKLTTIFVNSWKFRNVLSTYYQPVHSCVTNETIKKGNNTAFTKQCISYLLVLYLKLTFPNFTSQLMSTCAAVWRSAKKYVWWAKTLKIPTKKFIFQLGCSYSLQASNAHRNKLVHLIGIFQWF